MNPRTTLPCQAVRARDPGTRLGGRIGVAWPLSWPRKLPHFSRPTGWHKLATFCGPSRTSCTNVCSACTNHAMHAVTRQRRPGRDCSCLQLYAGIFVAIQLSVAWPTYALAGRTRTTLLVKDPHGNGGRDVKPAKLKRSRNTAVRVYVGQGETPPNRLKQLSKLPCLTLCMGALDGTNSDTTIYSCVHIIAIVPQ